MRHAWKEIPMTILEFGYYGKRRCRHCRAVQLKEDQQNWGRVVGYTWSPQAGRCVPLRWKKAQHESQETHCGRYRVAREPAFADSPRRWHALRSDMDEQLVTEGFHTRAEAKAYCEADAMGAHAPRRK